ncbi:MAG: hypothetical protein EOP06_10605 [Proteobacteria bacterium]|nr:MAG: hypothetical protein EOP06_10605 [Pseudomonadota bacterium]
MKLRTLLLLALAMLFFNPVVTLAADDASSDTFAGFDWSMTSDLRIESLYYPQSYGEGTNHNLNRLQLIPTFNGKSGEQWRAFIKPELFWDPQNNSASEKFFFEPREAFVKFKTPTFSVQAGNNIVNWGVTDGFNPLDSVNPRQYFDPLQSKKLGLTSLLFNLSTESTEHEWIVIPRGRASQLPGTNSRWLPREIFVPRSKENDVVLLLPPNIHFAYGETSELNDPFGLQGGYRLQHHAGSIDLGLILYEGAAAFPVVQPVVTGTIVQVSPKNVIQVDPEVSLRQKFYRQRQAGLTWVSSQMNFLLKLETSYSQSLGDDPLLPGWSHESVAALERNFGFGNAQLTGVLQYSYIRDQKSDESNLSVSDIFRRAWMLGGRMTWDEVWTLNVLALYDTLKYSHFEQLTLARRLQDVWTLEASAMFISGDSATPLGVYNKNDNYRLALSRSF